MEADENNVSRTMPMTRSTRVVDESHETSFGDNHFLERLPTRRYSAPHNQLIVRKGHSRNFSSQEPPHGGSQYSSGRTSPSSSRASSANFSTSAFLGIGGTKDIWTRLSTTFEIESPGPLAAPRMFAVNNSVPANAQAGPDLPEVQTEVDFEFHC